MQLTKHTDFSLRILMYVGLKCEERVTIAEIADRYNASKNHLVKVVHRLVQLGYLDSTQGRNGGLTLAVSPNDITVGEVVRNMEATLDVVNCEGTDCPIQPACRLKTALNKATDAFLESLDTVTLQDLIDNKTHLIRLIG